MTANPATPSDGQDHGYLAREFGDAITRAREADGESQRGQARRLGIAHNTLRELEQGLANPTLGRLESIATALGLRVRLTITRRR